MIGFSKTFPVSDTVASTFGRSVVCRKANRFVSFSEESDGEKPGSGFSGICIPFIPNLCLSGRLSYFPKKICSQSFSFPEITG
jgi:hypothetical protein